MTITGRSGGGQESGRIRRVRDAVMQAMDLPPGDARAASMRADLGNATDLALEAASLLNDVAASLDDADWGDPLIGRNAGEWTLESLIGTGGHGRVYRGRSAGGVWVAVKVLTRAGQGVRELEALRRLDHPGVAALLGHGELGTPHGPRTWIATELLEAAEPIIDFAAGEGLDMNARIALLRRVCEALAHAHDRGVVHRDLKPGNVLVTPDGAPHLIDFGIARMLDHTTLTATEDGRLVGTIAWLAPEQCDPSLGRVSPATDVHALGLIAFRLLTGEPPYDTGRSLAGAVQAVTHVPAADPRTLNPGISDAVAMAVMHALMKRPADRLQAGGDFLAAMDGKRTASRPSRHTRMRRTTLAIALPLQRAGL